MTGFVLFQITEEGKIESLAKGILLLVRGFGMDILTCHPNNAFYSNNSFAQQVSPTLTVSHIIGKGKKTDTKQGYSFIERLMNTNYVPST